MAVATKKNSLGFSMIELLVVVSLIAIMTSLVGVALITPRSRLHKTAMQDISKSSRHLFKHARDERIDMWLMFDMRKNEWHVEQNKITGDFVERVRYVNGSILEDNELPDGLTIKDIQVSSSGLHSIGEIGVYILPRGFIEPAVLHLISDLDERKEYSLVFQPLLGFVDIVEGYYELDRYD